VISPLSVLAWKLIKRHRVDPLYVGLMISLAIMTGGSLFLPCKSNRENDHGPSGTSTPQFAVCASHKVKEDFNRVPFLKGGGKIFL